MKYLPLLCLALILSSCSATPEPPATAEMVAPPPTREAVVILEKPKTVVLTRGGEPALLTSDYGRLAGVVEGDKPTVCLEVNGKGLALSLGETVNGYALVAISPTQATLKRRGE